MTKKEVDKCLSKAFKASFSRYKLKKDKKRFVIFFGNLYMKFGYAIVDSDVSFPSSFSFRIGTSALFNLRKKIFPRNYSDREVQYLGAISTGQANLFDQGKYPVLEYDIYTEENAQKMVDEVSSFILNQVLPEWEANPTLEYLEKKVNEKLPDVPNFSGLILARLVENPKYEMVKKHFIHVSKDWAEWDKKDLQKVIEFLDRKSLAEIKSIASK